MQFSEFQITPPPKSAIARSFGSKASEYDKNAHYQNLIIRQIIDTYGTLFKNGSVWADLGCGTGIFSQALKTAAASVSIIGLDISFDSLKVCHLKKSQYQVQADLEHLPFRKESLDGILVTSVMQWIPDQFFVLKSFCNYLRTNGQILFSIFTSKSFHEMNTIKCKNDISVPVSLPEKESLLSMIEKSGYHLLSTNETEVIYYYESARDALKSISSYGASAAGSRLSKKTIVKLCEDYEKEFRTRQGVPVTYESVIGIAAKKE